MKHSIFLFTLIIISYSSHAQDGTLDSSFGDNGKNAVQFYDDYSTIQSIIHSDGKLYALGETKPSREIRMTAVAFTSDGQLDMSFGTDGLLHPIDIRSIGNKLIELPDGTYLGVGFVKEGNLTELLMARFDTGGNLISNFGDSGIVREAFINDDIFSYDQYELIDVQYSRQNKIIAAGEHYNGENTDFFLISYNNDGSPNMNFGDGGYIIPDFEEEGWHKAQGLALHDGNIYVGVNSFEEYYQIHKFDSLGNAVTSFGQNGMIEIQSGTGGDIKIQHLVIEDDQYLVSLVEEYGSKAATHISKYNLDGIPLNSFGNAGTATIENEELEGTIKDFQLLPSGKIILGGATPFRDQFLLTRLLATGQIDRSFGNDGITITSISPTNALNGINSLDIDEEGAIYVGGITYDHANNMAIAKYHNTITATKASFIENEATIYPNPVRDNFTFSFTSKYRTKADIYLFDANGKRMEELFTGYILQGSNYFHFDISNDLPKGYYFLAILTEKYGVHIEKVGIFK